MRKSDSFARSRTSKRSHKSGATLPNAGPGAAAAAAAGPAAPPQDLTVEWVPIGDVTPYTDNPRVHHDVDGIANSLKTFGWRQPLVVDADGVLVVGHGRLLGAKKLGLAQVPIHRAVGLTPSQIRAYRLADNKAAEGAAWDEPKLLLELQALRDAGEDRLVVLSGFDLAGALDAATESETSSGGHDTAPQFMDGLVYRVVVDCADEADQAELLARFETEGRRCKALIS